MRTIALVMLTLILIVAPVYADGFQNGIEAYKKKDYKVALEKLTPLAEKGNDKAQFVLGLMYAHDLTRDDYFTTGWGTMDDEKAVKWFELVANKGNAFAQHNLGVMYEPRNYSDPEVYERRKWFRVSIKKGYSIEETTLSARYQQGLYINRDHDLAMKWYKLAAEQGVAASQFTLAWRYLNAGERDYQNAAKWFRLAAEQGVTPAQYWLGLMYLDGYGVVKNYTESYKWLNIVVAKGFEDAREPRDNLEERMNSDQIAEAQKLAREWMDKHQKK